MAFSVSEAHNLNVFCRWFFNEPRGMTVPTEAEATRALAALAASAHHRLMAGITGPEVVGLWAERRPAVALAAVKVPEGRKRR
jgi:hypothetical protein